MVATMSGSLKRWTVKAWQVDGFDHTPHDQITVEAESAKEARRAAARHFGFKPSDWCLKGSAFELEAYREEVGG